MKNWIVTHSGQEIDFDDLGHANFLLTDLIFALGRINRFTGHSEKPYTVLDHSIECFNYAQQRGWDPECQLACLCHDLHEGIIGDISTPVKKAVPGVKEFEARVEKEVHRALGLRKQSTFYLEIKQADVALLIAERDHYIPFTTPWPMEDQVTVPFSFRPMAYGETGETEFYNCLAMLPAGVLPPQFRDALTAFESRIKIS